MNKVDVYKKFAEQYPNDINCAGEIEIDYTSQIGIVLKTYKHKCVIKRYIWLEDQEEWTEM